MVTQLYTAPIRPYRPPGNAAATLNSATGSAVAATLSTDADGQNSQSPTLAAVQEQSQRGVISINSVMTDFQNTMDALGVTSSVRQEISPYLQVIAHQAQKDQPSSGLIKQNLRVAADTMDTFISDTLGQKSNVVKEWVDALLVQPIEYHTATPITLNEQNQTLAQTSGSTTSNDNNVFHTGSDASSLSLSDQESVRGQLKSADQTLKAGNYTEAFNQYQDVLATIGSANVPNLTGRVLYRMGQSMAKSGQPDAAQSFYQQAAEALAQNKNQPRLQATVAQALGKTAQVSGNLDTAALQYQSAIDFHTQTGDLSALGQVQTQLGQVYLKQNQYSAAHTVLSAAISNLDPIASPRQTVSALNSLGTISSQSADTVDPKSALGYLKQALQISQNAGLTQQTKTTWQNLAGLYLSINKPAKALNALQNAVLI